MIFAHKAKEKQKMNNSKQVEILKKVLDLEIYISDTNNKLMKTKAEKFSPMPVAPVCETVKRVYPNIVPQVKFDWVKALVPCIIFWPWIFIYYFAIYRKEQKEDIERIRNSAEYKAECAKLDEEYDKQQEAMNQKYNAEKHIYDTETLPKYNQALNEWKQQQAQKVNKLTEELSAAKTELESIYNETKIVPMQYRKIPVLQYIYDLMSTSDYEIKEAIDLYERNEQKKIDKARLYEQQKANALADEQNDLLYEQNEIADKARRQANFASAVDVVQRHNTNKTLKNMSKKKK